GIRDFHVTGVQTCALPISTKFLKNGSFMDLASSIKIGNIRPMLAAGLDNLALTRYLINEVRQSPDDRMRSLQYYLPNARKEDWELRSEEHTSELQSRENLVCH